MKPNEDGIWEWFDENGVKRLVLVYDASKHSYSSYESDLTVFFGYGYFSIYGDSADETVWPDRWGNRVGDIGSLPDDKIYLFPEKNP